MTRLMSMTFNGEERFRKIHGGGEADEAYAAGYDAGLEPHDAATASAGDRPHHAPGEHVGAHDVTDRLDAADVAHRHFEPHESPPIMTLPLQVLALCSAIGGLVGIPLALSFGKDINFFERWLDPVIVKVHEAGAGHVAAHHVEPIEYVLMILSVGIAILGIYLGKLFYERRTDLADIWAAKLRPFYTLSFNKWYWDSLLDDKGVEAGKAVNNALWKVDSAVVDGGVNGAGWLTRLWAKLSGLWDKYVIDLAVNATGWITRAGSIVLRSFQTGFWQNYVLVFALGLFLILLLYIFPSIPVTIRGFTGK
jgi:NADH:ubiquinone oxidoreductase subunit 5 (subunit L)/multisubunit Na+/H+ antiporter MnhA subunit